MCISLSPLNYKNYSPEDALQDQIERLKKDAKEHPEDAQYDMLMIKIRERELAIEEEHPNASPEELKELYSQDQLLKKLNAQLVQFNESF